MWLSRDTCVLSERCAALTPLRFTRPPGPGFFKALMTSSVEAE